ncbi:hypothetical protein [Mesorhizobium sp. B1-1-1]|uniref:hypothetical protein n=1 Tax=Mesorhizobium sp. B1-1-1 TaxID=2589983 RepID=UPI0015E41D3F|nr:hypothetical protein [Mesorhizobium sp. B1-1-1]
MFFTRLGAIVVLILVGFLSRFAVADPLDLLEYSNSTRGYSDKVRFLTIFKLGSPVLEKSARGISEAAMKKWVADGNKAMIVVGHADDLADDDLNLSLGLSRAANTAKVLTSDGADPTAVAVLSAGEMFPLISVPNEEQESHNRRVEMFLTDDQWNNASAVNWLTLAKPSEPDLDSIKEFVPKGTDPSDIMSARVDLLGSGNSFIIFQTKSPCRYGCTTALIAFDGAAWKVVLRGPPNSDLEINNSGGTPVQLAIWSSLDDLYCGQRVIVAGGEVQLQKLLACFSPRSDFVPLSRYLIGRWSTVAGCSEETTITFASDGKGTHFGTPMRWEVSGDIVHLSIAEQSIDLAISGRRAGEFSATEGTSMSRFSACGS